LIDACVFSVCGREFRRPSGVIVSPNYPDNYAASRSCEWVIVQQTGRQILLRVADFSLESSPNCTNDYVEIRSGADWLFKPALAN